MSNTIYHNFHIQTSLAAVYAAVSQPEHLINWWPQTCIGKPALGAEYNFYFTQEYDWYGKVVACVPNQAFHIKMTKSDADWDPTTFGFDLAENGNGVQVSFWHRDWPASNEHFKIASFCWAMLLNGLKNYLEKGIVVPFEARS